MKKQSILIYPAPLSVLKAIIDKRHKSGKRTNQRAVIEELIFSEAEKEGIDTKKIFAK